MKLVQSILSVLVLATAITACGTEGVELDPNVTLRILPPTTESSSAQVQYVDPNSGKWVLLNEIAAERLMAADWEGIEIAVTEEGEEDESFRVVLNLDDTRIAQPISFTTAVPVDSEFRIAVKLVRNAQVEQVPAVYETVLRAERVAEMGGVE